MRRIGLFRFGVVDVATELAALRRLSGLCALLLCALASPWLPRVDAQSTVGADEPAGYRALVEQALSEYQLRNFEEARALFSRAHALHPSARTLRGLGMTEYELRNYVESADYFRQALASRVRPLEGPLRAETEASLARAEAFIGRVQLELEPVDATLRLDGESIALPADGVLVLAVGDHVLEASAPGHAGERRALRLIGNDRLALRIVLARGGASEGAAGQDRVPADEPGGPGAWPWVVIGASGAVMVAGGVLVALAQSDIAEVEDAKDGTDWPEVEDAYDAAPIKSGAGIAMLGAGAAGVTMGLLWKFAWSDEPSEDRAGAVEVGVSANAVTLRGKW